MVQSAGNTRLHKAQKNANDEYYTQLSDIEIELYHYREHFNGKVVFCNCDDPYESNFFKYFAMNFNFLKLKKLIATCYSGSPVMGKELPLFDRLNGKRAFKIEITEVKDETGNGTTGLADVEVLLKNDKNVLTVLGGNGDFRSKECVELLKQADIVVTNPPFSLFREYVAQLVEYEKKFIIIGCKTALGYREIFPLVKDNKIWVGYTPKVKTFKVPDDYQGKLISIGKDGKKYANNIGNVSWFTNIETTKRHEELILYKEYSSDEYPKYDNYDAINVDKTNEIPKDYDGVMGVPISFLDKYNPDQFEIISFRKGNDGKDLSVRGVFTFSRVLIRKRKKK